MSNRIDERTLRVNPATRVFVLGLLLFPVTADPSSAAESVYTSVDLKVCKSLSNAQEADEGPGDFYFGKCRGYKNYPVYFKEGDLRQSLSFGFLDKRLIDEGNETFGPFNHITNGKVEWRLDAEKKPYAAIMRFTLENMNEATGMPDKAHEGQMLVVYRVARAIDGLGCVVGYVDALANKAANEIARKIADENASAFRCGKDKATSFGIMGPLSSELASSLPELP